MPLAEEAMGVWSDVRGKGEKELKAAAKDLLKIGRDAFSSFLNEVKDIATSETSKQIADLYARAELKALRGSRSANRILRRLNLTARAMANVKRSQKIKQAIAIWDSVLKVVTSLATKLASIGSAGLSDLASAGIDAAKGLVDKTTKKKSTKKKSSSKKSSTKKKSTKKSNEDDEVIVVEDD